MLDRLLKIRFQMMYAGMWVVFALLHFLVLRTQYNIPANIASTESILFNTLYGLLGAGLWFYVRFSDLQNRSKGELIFAHLSGITVVLLIWIGPSYLILRRVFSEYPDYLTFLSDSLIFRCILGIFYYLGIVSISYLLVNMKNLKEQKDRELKLNNQLKQAELDLLKSQIKPHFLFNCLNSISSLSLTKPEDAHKMTILLSEYIRYSLDAGNQQFSTYGKELNHIQQYLQIEKIRFGKRLEINIEEDIELSEFPVPSMLLQPLIENAVKHGMFESIEGSMINFKASKLDNGLSITVTNTFDPDAPPVKGTGTGLKNTKSRLLNIYKKSNLLKVQKEDNTFIVELMIPRDEPEYPMYNS